MFPQRVSWVNVNFPSTVCAFAGFETAPSIAIAKNKMRAAKEPRNDDELLPNIEPRIAFITILLFCLRWPTSWLPQTPLPGNTSADCAVSEHFISVKKHHGQMLSSVIHIWLLETARSGNSGLQISTNRGE